MAKEIVDKFRMHVSVGAATPATMGPVFGQRGLSAKEFCDGFNSKTKDLEQGTPLPVSVRVYKDKSFDFDVGSPLASFLVKKYAGIKSGSGQPNKDKVGKLSREQLVEIAAIKQHDLNAASEEAAIRIIAGTARSMGIEVPS